MQYPSNMSTVAIDRTWDMTPYYPGLTSPEFEKDLSTVLADSRSFAEKTAQLPAADHSLFDPMLTELNRLLEDMNLIGSYVECLMTVDSISPAPQRAAGRLAQGRADLSKATSSLNAWIGTLNIEALLTDSKVARDHEFAVRKAAISARKLMSPSAESVAADLAVSGRMAWDKLYSNATSQIEVTVPGQEGTFSMSGVRNFAYNPDPAVRRAAFEAELATWKENEVTIAACLNSIKGASLTVCKHRGWRSPLEAALFDSNIDQETLDAMLSAAESAFPNLRRYMSAKAKALGLGKLGFCDMFAPLGADSGSWEYDDAEKFVATQFASFSPRMSGLAERAFRERWVDVFPRAGKVGGAYCASTRGDESRILMNFKSSYNHVSTLAHELGHAYHNLCLDGRTGLQHETPMTLAETASTFCETIVRNAALAEASEAQALSILEAGLQGATQVVIDISSRFRFEAAFFERRSSGEATPDEIVEMMLRAQRSTYGDGLDPNLLHGYMWAAKPHYYGADYYNFPYMFGLLFGVGLYAVYRAEPRGFQDRYDTLLSRTGMADAATLASNFGIDIRSTEFWAASLAEIEADVDRFCALVGG